MEDSKLQHSQNENAKRKRVKLVNKRHNVLARQEILRVLTQERKMPNASHAREKPRISRPDTWNALASNSRCVRARALVFCTLWCVCVCVCVRVRGE